jgi:hypothetical protein
MAIVTRQTTSPGVINRNQPLTNAEIDNNFIELFNGNFANISTLAEPNSIVRRDQEGGSEFGNITLGNKVIFSSFSSVVNLNTPVVIDSWSIIDFRSAIYSIQVTQGSKYHLVEYRVIHDGNIPYSTEYAFVNSAQIGTYPQPTIDAVIELGQIKVSLFISDAASTPATIIIDKRLFRHF